jgi:hypothetical protein
MKVMAFNGSPRKKKWNTVTLLKNALKGAASVGAETEAMTDQPIGTSYLKFLKNPFSPRFQARDREKQYKILISLQLITF